MTSLYIHIPFCAKKCFYCSFVVSVGQEKRMDIYLDALEKEMKLYKSTKLGTVYFGGGTPSLLSVEQLKRLMDMVRCFFDVSTVKEWTIETNPDDVCMAKTAVLKENGVNRFSLGIQTFSDHRLRELGRNHSSRQAYEAYDLYRKAGCQNISVDLMFAFSRQSLDELKADLKEITGLKSEHISIYCLNIEKNSRFYTKAIQQPDDEEQILFYETIVSCLQKKGWNQYEVSNFAQSGFQSMHNRNYWEGGNYIGLGVAAHSFVDGRRYYNTNHLSEYIEKAVSGSSCVQGEEHLSDLDRFTENILFRLRMNEGVIIKELEERFKTTLTAQQKACLDKFSSEGLLIQKGGSYRASDRGRLVLDEMAPYFLES